MGVPPLPAARRRLGGFSFACCVRGYAHPPAPDSVNRKDGASWWVRRSGRAALASAGILAGRRASFVGAACSARGRRSAMGHRIGPLLRRGNSVDRKGSVCWWVGLSLSQNKVFCAKMPGKNRIFSRVSLRGYAALSTRKIRIFAADQCVSTLAQNTVFCAEIAPCMSAGLAAWAPPALRIFPTRPAPRRGQTAAAYVLPPRLPALGPPSPPA